MLIWKCRYTAASLIPGVDTFADLASVPVDLLRGDYVGAGLSAVGVIPVIGEVADAAKAARIADHAADAVKAVDRAIDASKSAKTTGKAIDVLKELNKHRDVEVCEKAFNEITNNIAKRSPMRIPKNATKRYKEMNSGYDQIFYNWKRGKYDYEARWHTHTPGAPEYSQVTWVIERRIKGIGYGKNRRDPKTEYLIGKNKWISEKEWDAAKTARRLKKETEESRRILDNGHWADK